MGGYYSLSHESLPSIQLQRDAEAARTRVTGATLLHGALGVLALLACLLAPRPGSAVLLVPMRTDSTDARGLLDAGTAVLGNGRLGGSIVILPSTALSTWGLVRKGYLPIAAPAALCSAGGTS